MDLLAFFLYLLLLALVFGVVYWGVHRIINDSGMPKIVGAVVDVVLVILFVYIVISMFLGGVEIPRLRFPIRR